LKIVPLLELARHLLTAPIFGAVTLAALVSILLRRGLLEASEGPTSRADRVLDRRTVCLLAILAAAVAARFMVLSG
jgi:hypothetical protein